MRFMEEKNVSTFFNVLNDKVGLIHNPGMSCDKV